MRAQPDTSDVPIRAEEAVARVLADNNEVQRARMRLLEAIGTALQWPAGAFWETPVEWDDAMRCVETWHAGGPALEVFASATRNTRLTLGEGLPGRAWATGQPLWLSDVTEVTNFPRAAAAVQAGLRAAFCFPVRSRGRVLGAIEFFDREWQEPDAALLATMVTLGGQIGQFLEWRRAEAAVVDGEQLRRAMLESAIDAVVTIDAESRIVEFNPSAERIFGRRREHVIGRDLAETIIPRWLREQHRRGFERYLASGEPRVLDRRVEIVGLRADGTEFPVELTITRVWVPGPARFTGYLRDITDRRRAEDELRASRTRIIEAADAERRRIERNLHDGAQQRLVWVGYELRSALRTLERDPAAAAGALEEAIAGLAEAAEELRELARGIHPAVLTEGGLEPALTVLAERCSTPVTVEVACDERFPEPVETAAYFTAAEALTNVDRHASAQRAIVALRHSGTSLVLEVTDDGRGGADGASGSGLRGLADRVGAIGGTLTVESPPRGGTTVRAEMPCA